MDKMNISDKTVDINQDSTRNRKNQTEILSLNIRKGFILKNRFEQIKLKILEALPKICMFQEVAIPFYQIEELIKNECSRIASMLLFCMVSELSLLADTLLMKFRVTDSEMYCMIYIYRGTQDQFYRQIRPLLYFQILS